MAREEADVYLDGLPAPGPPFVVGEEVAFFPTELGPTSMWLAWDYAVIDDVDYDAETFGFHFVGDPDQRHAQGMENIVRRTANYVAWREAWEASFARNGDEKAANRDTDDLLRRVLAEHPIHGPTLGRHNATVRPRAHHPVQSTAPPPSVLHRFWIELEVPVRGLRQFGVTAFDMADALALIDDHFETGPLPDTASVVVDIDVDTLDANHILPNIGPPIFRGVWYPMTSLR